MQTNSLFLQNAILSPFWNINAHSVVYMIQGRAQVQVVNNHGQTVFNDILRQGQLIIIPQHYVVLKKAARVMRSQAEIIPAKKDNKNIKSKINCGPKLLSSHGLGWALS